MDWSSRRIHPQRQGSNHFVPNINLNESARRRGYMVPETADQFGGELFTNHHHRFPHQLNIQHSPFPYHYPSYRPLHHPPPQDTCSRILREMEKEKIREEIMMSEVARRRALEAEVRFELMLEQQNNHGLLPLRSSPRRDFLSPSRLPPTRSGSSEKRPLEEKTVMSRDHSKSQCQNEILCRVETDLKTAEEVKPMLPFLLPKPADETLSGSKRKAPEAPHGADTSELLLHGSCSRIKAKEAWSCALCLFRATSKQGLEEHLNGEKHKANEDALRSESARKNHGVELLAKKETTEPIQIVSAKAASPLKNETEEALEPLPKSAKPEDLKKDEAGPVRKPEGDGDVIANDKGYKFWCEICGVGTFSQKVMNTHKAGRKHTRQVQHRDRTGWSLCLKNAAANNEESVVEEDGNNKCVAASKGDAEVVIKEEDVAMTVVMKPEDYATDSNTSKNGGDHEVGAIGCDLVDDIKEEDWWAYMDVANAENGLIDDAMKLSTC